ncbi:MAG TPA: acyl-CoA dehydrogenase family protein, partial [Planctomycetaceae bacterium]|nr:acyl-CoA dehydrogenase family protein [Planctomycetaceae bacterium]
MTAPPKANEQLVERVRQFVRDEILPVASRLEHADEYPAQIVEGLKRLGLFGCNVPRDFGGLGLDYTTFAKIIEELARGWMSVVGPLGTHSVICDIIHRFGTDEQKRDFLPGLASGSRRGGLALTEADAGTDVKRLQTTATRQGDGYLINGSKMWITNGKRGDTFVLAAKTQPHADPPHKGISAFLIEKGRPGFRVVREIDTLGYRGVENCELAFENFLVPAKNLIGGVEGEGFKQIMTGLESERINVAARGVGVARAAFEDALAYSQKRQTFGKPICEHQTIQIKLADMATRIEASRLLVYSAAEKKDRGERCDL